MYSQTLRVDESMNPYSGCHGAKQYIHGKPIKYRYKMWVLVTRLCYTVKLYPYQRAGTTDKELGLSVGDFSGFLQGIRVLSFS